MKSLSRSGSFLLTAAMLLSVGAFAEEFDAGAESDVPVVEIAAAAPQDETVTIETPLSGVTDDMEEPSIDGAPGSDGAVDEEPTETGDAISDETDDEQTGTKGPADADDTTGSDDTADDSGETLTAPVITAQNAEKDDQDIWSFSADDETTEISFSWTCDGVQSFLVKVTAEDGGVLINAESSEPELALDTELLEENVLYELRVTAVTDGMTRESTLVFMIVSSEEIGESELSAENDGVEEAENIGATSAETDRSAGQSTKGSSMRSGGGTGTGRTTSSGRSGGSGSPGTGRSSSAGSGRSGGSSKQASGAGRESEAASPELAEGAVSGILLDEGRSEYTAELSETTLRLVPTGDGAEWEIESGALDALYEAGLRTLELVLSDEVYTLRLSEPEVEAGAGHDPADKDGAAPSSEPDDESEEQTETSPALRVDADGVTLEGQTLWMTVGSGQSGTDGPFKN